MIKQLTFLILLVPLLSIVNLMAQSPAKSLMIGNKHLYTHFRGPFAVTSIVVEEVVGDTVINGVKYSIIRETRNNREIFRYQRSDTSRVFEYYNSLEEKLLYDLNWAIGDTVLNTYRVATNTNSTILDTIIQEVSLYSNSLSVSLTYHQLFGLTRYYSFDYDATVKNIEAAIIDQKAYGDTSLFVNRPPVFISQPDTFVVKHYQNPYVEYNYDIRAVDPDGESVTYEIIQAPSGFMLDNYAPSQSALFGQVSDTGKYRIEIMASDSRGGKALQSFNLHVVSLELPVITSFPDIGVNINVEYRYQVIVTRQPYGDLYYYLAESPKWLSISNKGLITGVPTIEDIGLHYIKILAYNRDYYSGDAVQEYNLSVFEGRLILYQNYPNPFNTSTTIKYNLPISDKIEIRLYNVLGEIIKESIIEYQDAGLYSINFDGHNLPSGVYFYQIRTSTNQETKKCLLIK